MSDYCAGCGVALKAAPLGGRYRCCSDMYWSPAAPEARDRILYERWDGEPIRVQTACVNPSGAIVRHAPLYLYRALG